MGAARVRYALTRVSGPAEEALTRAAAKTHLRVDSDQSAEDALIDVLVSAAREAAEDETNRCFVWSTWELVLDAFPAEIRLPRPPLIRVNAITYVDAAGVTQTLGSDNYQVDARSEPARVVPAVHRSWPATRAQLNAVTVSYVAGYPIDESGSPTDYAAHVPATALAAMKLTLAHWFNHREEVVSAPGVQPRVMPYGAKWLLWKLRVMDFTLSH